MPTKTKMYRSTTFACFSPPVMMATFIIEMLCAAYVLWHYRMNLVSKLVSAICVNLAIFQFAEYFVCTGSVSGLAYSRLGYAAITLLPALGFWLMCELSGKTYKPLMYSVMAVATGISVYFLLHKNSFESYQCTGNYVIFQIGKTQTTIYTTYYFGLLSAAVLRGSYALFRSKHVPSRAVKWLLVGYAAFIIPVGVITTLHPDTREAVPSILCGFAVTLALILITRVMPLNELGSDQPSTPAIRRK